MLDICQKITAAIPADAQTEQEIIDAILNAVRPQMESLFGVTEIDIENGQFVLSGRWGKTNRPCSGSLTRMCNGRWITV